MAEAEIALFLSRLATESNVSSSTQNQALNALLFLYKEVLDQKIGFIQGIVRAKRSRRLPVVLTKEEVKRVLSGITGTPWLMAMLLYGAGLRLMECCRLRVKDVDFSKNQIVILKRYFGERRLRPSVQTPRRLPSTLKTPPRTRTREFL
jgi:integrase